MNELSYYMLMKKINQNMYLNKPIPKAYAIAEVVGPCKMSIQRCRIELGQNIHFIDPTINAIAHWHIDQSI